MPGTKIHRQRWDEALVGEVPLGGGLVATVSEEDWEIARSYTWSLDSDGYPSTDIGQRNRRRLHQLLMPVGEGFEVDHKDGNQLNNRRENLRVATRRQNMANSRMRRNNTSGFKGVTWSNHCRKWRSKISDNWETRHLGLFNDPVEAAEAYDRAAREIYGEFACVNFPQEGERGVLDAS